MQPPCRVDDLTCESVGNLQVGDSGTLSSNIEVTGNAGIISIFPIFDGNLTVGGDLVILFFDRSVKAGSQITIGGDCLSLRVDWTHSGDISVGGDLTTALFNPQLLWSTPGNIEAGRLLGTMTIAEEYQGELQIHGDCSGSIDIAEDLTGSIAIDGDLSGSIDVGGEVNSFSAGSGRIAVDGSFASTAAITVQLGFAGVTEFISCNNNGAAPGVWEAGATVTLWASKTP